MKIEYFYKTYLKVLDGTQNLIQANILMQILARWNGTNKPLLQQTYIARRLFVDDKTIRNHIKTLIENGYIKTKKSFYTLDNGVKLPSTQFEILPRLKRLVFEEKEIQPKQNQTITRTDKSQYIDMYDFYDKIMAEQNESIL
jgi:predicted transcriptional regulator